MRPFVNLLMLSVALAGIGCRGEDDLPALPALEEEVATPRRDPVAGAVTILTDARPESLSGALDAVRDHNPDLDVRVVRVDSEGVGEALESVDVVLLEAPWTARSLTARGALAVLDPDLLAAVPPPFRGPGGRFVALSVRARVIIAKRLMANRPLSVLDLRYPRWRGKITRTRALHPAFVEQLAATLVDHGDGQTRRFSAGFQANTTGEGVVPDQRSALVAVVKRTASLAWVDHVDFHRHVFADPFDPEMSSAAAEQAVAESNIEVLYPDRDGKGVPWSATVGGITTGAAHPEAALAVLYALLTADGQRAYAWPRREYPVVEGLSGPPGTASDFPWSGAGFEQRAEVLEDALLLAEELDASPAEPSNEDSPAPNP
jgi:iron(III) transport system substrate-binding protein